ncbi:hypothetical protein HDV02_006374, partial [Globomyces sp. JEL0801]
LLLCKVIVTNDLPFQIVDNKLFRQLFNMLKPGMDNTLIHRTTLRTDIQHHYKKNKEQVKNRLAKID